MHSKDAQPSHTSVYRFKKKSKPKNRVRLTIKTVHRKSSKFMHTHLRPIGKKMDLMPPPKTTTNPPNTLTNSDLCPKEVIQNQLYSKHHPENIHTNHIIPNKIIG